jgi:CRISPR-associated endonuclease/helicase Cas3
MTLTATQFPDFYRAVNGFTPFPWQTRLVETVTAHGGLWPSVLDLPTSSGKTSALDVAVFLLAMQAGESVHDRTAALRTFFVVDRRIVVDEAADKARNMARLLNTADGAPAAPARLQAVTRQLRKVEPDQPDPLSPDDIAIIKDVAARLRQYGGDKALHVSVLRGGMYRDGSWAESPTQPTICLSTVDQVGSRLLFRGYGVSPYQRAVHAGLVGNDALILLDEAHLSRPFLETLKAVEFYRSNSWAECEVKTPFQVVVMSATAGVPSSRSSSRRTGRSSHSNSTTRIATTPS